MGVAVAEVEVPERLRRFDPGEWCPPGTAFFGAEGHEVWRRARARWVRARTAWAAEHGVAVKDLGPAVPVTRPYPYGQSRG